MFLFRVGIIPPVIVSRCVIGCIIESWMNVVVTSLIGLFMLYSCTSTCMCAHTRAFLCAIRQDADLDLRFVKYVVFDEIDNLLKPRNNPHVTAVMQRLQQLPGRSQTQTRYKEQQQSNGKNTNASNGTGNGNDRASTQSNQSFFEDDRASHLQHQHNTATTTTHYHHQQQHNQQQERPAIDQSSSNESVVGGSALSEGLQSYLKSIGRDVTTHEHEMDFRTHNQPPSSLSSSSSSSFASPIEVLEKEQSMLRSHRQPDSTQALIARYVCMH